MDNCALCLNPIDVKGRRKVYVTECQHRFHMTCFQRLQGQTTVACPCCRHPVVPTIDHQVKIARKAHHDEKQALRACRRQVYWQLAKKEHEVRALSDKLQQARLEWRQLRDETQLTLLRQRNRVLKSHIHVYDALIEQNVHQRQRSKST